MKEANLGHVYEDKNGQSVIYNGGILYEFNEDELKKISKRNYDMYERFYNTQYRSHNKVNYDTCGLTDGDVRAMLLREEPELSLNEWLNYY